MVISVEIMREDNQGKEEDHSIDLDITNARAFMATVPNNWFQLNRLIQRRPCREGILKRGMPTHRCRWTSIRMPL